MASTFSILIVASRLPRPVGKGDSMTVYHLLKFLAARGHRIHLVSFTGVDPFKTHSEQALLDVLNQWCETVDLVPMDHGTSRWKAVRGILSSVPLQVWYFRYEALQQKIDRILARHDVDVLYAHNFRTAQYLWKYPHYPTVSGLMLSYALNYKRMVQHIRPLHKRLFYAVEYRRLRRYEATVLDKLDRVLLISPHDKAAIEGSARFNNVFFNPHGLDVAYYAEPLDVEKVPHSLIMTGDFGYPPNWDAALFFYEHIYPKVQRHVPDVQLWLVGREPTRAIQQLMEDPSVTVTGWVEDLRTYLQRAEVGVVPIRIAAGMQNKIVVGMASGLPLVATRASNEGIGAMDGETIVLADHPDAFAEAVIRLLKQPEVRQMIGHKAKLFAQSHWTWAYHFSHLERMLQGLIEHGPEAPVEQYILQKGTTAPLADR